MLLLALTFLAMGLTISSAAPPRAVSTGWLGWGGNATESAIDFTKNDLLLGSQDPIFWFLVPLFGLINVGICVGVNYVTLGLTNLFYLPYNFLTARPAWVRVEDVRYANIQLSVYQEASSTNQHVVEDLLLPTSLPAHPEDASLPPAYYSS